MTHLHGSLAGKQQPDPTVFALVLDQDPVDVDLSRPVDVGDVVIPRGVVVVLVKNLLPDRLLGQLHLVGLPGTDDSQII